MKKLMVLGGSRYALPVIRVAHDMGIYVITCDYLPHNIAHQFSDKYCNVSIVDKNATLEAAKENKIDGIISFACDPGVVTAAYVADQMGLPNVGPYESVRLLQNKGAFRRLLTDNGFNVPTAKSYTDIEDALNDIDLFHWPVIVKPTDSAGSKGVHRIDNPDELRSGIEYALSFSLGKEFIIEDFIQQKGFSSDSDSFSVDGELKFVSFNSQRFDPNAANPYTPAAYTWPSSMTESQEKELTSEIQRLIKLLNMKTTIYNIETRVGTDNKTYIMEVSPRGGGNRLAEMLRYSTSIDLIDNAVRAAMGENCVNLQQKPYDGHWGEIILHSKTPGTFAELKISDEIHKNIIERDLWINPGDKVGGFASANEAIGTLVLRFDSENELNQVLGHQDDYVRIITK